MKSHTQKMGLVVAGLFIGFYALCLAWGLFISDPVLKTLHFNLLQIAYPGFAFTTLGILIGLAESIVYGYFFGALFTWLCRVCCARNQR